MRAIEPGIEKFFSSADGLALMLHGSPTKIALPGAGGVESSTDLRCCKMAVYTTTVSLLSPLAGQVSAPNEAIVVTYVRLLDVTNAAMTSLAGESPKPGHLPMLLDGRLTVEKVMQVVRKTSPDKSVTDAANSMRAVLDVCSIAACDYPPRGQPAARSAIDQFVECLLSLCRHLVAVDGELTSAEQDALIQITTVLCKQGKSPSAVVPAAGALPNEAGADQPALAQVLATLNGMIGLDSVKRELNSLSNLVRIRQMRVAAGAAWQFKNLPGPQPDHRNLTWRRHAVNPLLKEHRRMPAGLPGLCKVNTRAKVALRGSSHGRTARMQWS